MPTRRPLRVVHVAGTPDGAPWLVAFLREQKALGHDVTAILPAERGTIAPQLDAAGIPWRGAQLNIFAGQSPLGIWRLVRELARLLRELSPDVVHSHLFPTLIITRMAAWIADVPIRVSMNCGPYHLQTPSLRELETGLAWMDTLTIASCELTRELMVHHGIPRQQVELVYYAVDQSGFDPALADGTRVRHELGISAGAPVIGQVAHFYEPATNPIVTPPGLVGRGVKGHEVILRAAPEVLAQFPDATFVFTGTGWGPGGMAHKAAMESLASEIGVAHAVKFTGNRNDVPDVLASFDVALQCSLNENLGGSVEALLMARPAVVSGVGGLTDTVIHEKTGLVVPPDDPAALAAAIVRLLRNREWSSSLGAEGRALMLERFSLARSVADLERLYEREAAAERPRYRRVVSLVRSLLLPFRVGPLAARVRSALAPRRSTARGAIASHLSARVNRTLHRALKRQPRSLPGAPLRIAQVVAASSGSPWFLRICEELVRRGHDVVAIIDSAPGDLAQRLRDKGVRVASVRMVVGERLDRARLPLYLLQIPLSIARLAWILRRERVVIAQSHIFIANLLTRVARVLVPVRHIGSIVSPRHLQAGLTRGVDRLTSWLDDRTVAGCASIATLYREFGGRQERLHTIYYGTPQHLFDPASVDPTAFRRALALDNDTPLVGLVAYFYPPTSGPQTPASMRGAGVKGHEHFLAAAAMVSRRFPEARFVLAGRGLNARGDAYRESLIARCRDDERLRDRVLFVGETEHVPALLSALDVAVQCSLTEGMGGTIEALLMARPLVATNVGGMPEAVIHEQTGLLVPPADPDALAAAIERLLTNREEALALGRAGRKFMLSRFTLDRTIDDLEALYRDLQPPTVIDGQEKACARG